MSSHDAALAPARSSVRVSAALAEAEKDPDPAVAAAARDARVNGRAAWLLEQLGEGFVLLAFGERAVDVPTVAGVTPRLNPDQTAIADGSSTPSCSK